jgi:RIP metalloprotease RseP
VELLRMAGIGLFVVFFFGLCIFVHELGHFLVARWRKLHVVAFSIGFVKAYGWMRDGIEYRIGWLPFGGYVDLPQIDATGEPKLKDGTPLPPAKPFDRILTAAAGPACNILFGFLLGAFLWWHGIPQDTPKMTEITVSELATASPEYEAGLRDGDRIVRVNGRRFYDTWNGLVREIIFTVGDVELEVLRDGAPLTVRYRPTQNREKLQGEDIAYPFFLPTLPLVVQVRPDSPAAAAGMKNGDEIVEVDEKPLARHSDLAKLLANADGSPIQFKVRREGQVVTLEPATPARTSIPDSYLIGIEQQETLRAVVSRVAAVADGPAVTDVRKGDRILRINGRELVSVEKVEAILQDGAAMPVTVDVERDGKTETCVMGLTAHPGQVRGEDAFAITVEYQYGPPIRVARVMPGYPAEAAGIRAGDELLRIDDRDIVEYATLPRAVQAAKGKAVSLAVSRQGETLTFAALTPLVRGDYDLGLEWVIYNHPTPWRQLVDTVTMSYKSVRGILAKMFFGSSTLKPSHLSGPIGIVRAIGITVDRGGIIPALSLIVMITFSLAILNLMPLPVLDGGHIVMALYERIFRRPVPVRVVQPLFAVFVVLLISLMLYVTFFDVRRMMPKSVSRDYWLRPAPDAAGML